MNAPTDAPFVPRRGRTVALTAAIVSVVVFGVVALVLPGPEQGGNWDLLNRALVVGLGVAVAALLYRFARIAAWPRENGLDVRNLMIRRTIAWSDIEDVRFGGGEPWVTVELIDGETVAVMAIQRADGPTGEAEAHRLADLIAERQQPRAG